MNRLTNRSVISTLQKDVLTSFNFLSRRKPVSGVFDGNHWRASGPVIECKNPSTGHTLARVQLGDASDYRRCSENAKFAQEEWKNTPAPVRGSIVRQIGDALRKNKEELGVLLSLEMGKIETEALGEVQEFIDICDFACGLSRQLPGHVFPSERRNHTLLENWEPLGTVGIITAFNFPHAVFGWNSAISMVCGNTQVVKGAETASLVSIATQQIIVDVLRKNALNPGIATLCQGYGADVGEAMLHDENVDLVSFTGSTRAGKRAQQVVNDRFGQTLLELGGNNAIVVMPSADINNAIDSVLFAAVGTCGQRCTSLRRLLVHEDIYDSFLNQLTISYKSKLKLGHPMDPQTNVGPLHNEKGVELFLDTMIEVPKQGGNVRTGGTIFKTDDVDLKNGHFVNPALVEIDAHADIVQEERFVPVLYVSKIKSLDEGIAINNSVKQGLSSALFSNDMKEVFKWIHSSDTGIVNVNTSCSGAEIGAAFGGNKETGWGRESGSDAWKQYMRRSTVCINHGEGPVSLAQGVQF